jgi:hypothetical protein
MEEGNLHVVHDQELIAYMQKHGWYLIMSQSVTAVYFKNIYLQCDAFSYRFLL